MRRRGSTPGSFVSGDVTRGGGGLGRRRPVLRDGRVEPPPRGRHAGPWAPLELVRAAVGRTRICSLRPVWPCTVMFCRLAGDAGAAGVSSGTNSVRAGALAASAAQPPGSSVLSRDVTFNRATEHHHFLSLSFLQPPR